MKEDSYLSSPDDKVVGARSDGAISVIRTVDESIVEDSH